MLPAEIHQIGKDQTQSIERKHLDLRTRIKWLARRTICFSKSELMHDTVIGLLINHLFLS
nr:IS1 family transposase [Spirosoma utsteinense]